MEHGDSLGAEASRCEGGKRVTKTVKFIGAKVERRFFNLRATVDSLCAKSNVVGLGHSGPVGFVRVPYSNEV